MDNLKSTYSIKFPPVRTYFIAYTDSDVFAYGWVDPDQEMTTGQPYFYETTNEAEWVYKLETEFHTNPFPDQDNL